MLARGPGFNPRVAPTFSSISPSHEILSLFAADLSGWFKQGYWFSAWEPHLCFPASVDTKLPPIGRDAQIRHRYSTHGQGPSLLKNDGIRSQSSTLFSYNNNAILSLPSKAIPLPILCSLIVQESMGIQQNAFCPPKPRCACFPSPFIQPSDSQPYHSPQPFRPPRPPVPGCTSAAG